MLNASTWGRTIPEILGMTRSTFLAIWAANIRHGNSSKKGKKKGVKTYIENIDMLIGTNPIEGVLQMWSNNTNRYNLNFLKYHSPIGNAVVIPDPDFYFLVGATAELGGNARGIFNDYGDPSSGALLSGGSGGGSGYTGASVVSVIGPGTPATIAVSDAFGGTLNAFFVLDGGSGFEVGHSYPTITLSGGGSGAIIPVGTVAKRVIGGTQEYPLYNIWQPGPDLVNAWAMQWWPYVYSWRPGSATVSFYGNGFGDFTYGIPYGNGFVDLYYAQLASTKPKSPMSFNRFTFEPVLANGTEYADAGLSAQQELMPEYAGAGSSDADLGATGMIPDWRIEVKGKQTRWPSGDCDFVDMIAHIIKAAQVQVGTELGLIHQGLNCNVLPGFVQKNMFASLEPANPPIVFPQPNSVGSILIAIFQWRGSTGAAPVATDTAGNTYHPVLNESDSSLYWASSVGFGINNFVSSTFTGAGFAFDARFYIFEADSSSDTLEDSDSASGTTVGPQVVTVAVDTAGPALLLLYVRVNGTPVGSTLFNWTDLNPSLNFGTFNMDQPLVMQRIVKSAGHYAVSFNVAGGTPYRMALVAIAQSQPSKFPETLGDILDKPSLDLTRQQCQANGLSGALCGNAQRPAADWLKDIYTCADAAPVWSGFKLKTIPRSEVSNMGNGAVYFSPTASGPIAFLTQSDLIGDDKNPPLTIDRAPLVDANNVMQIEHVNRANDYNFGVVSEIESATIAVEGPRKDSPLKLDMIQSADVARRVLAIETRRKVYLRRTYKFKMLAKWIWLEAMDLINLTMDDPASGISSIDLRIVSISENDKYELEVEAEPFLYGVNAPDPLVATVVAPNNFDSGVVPSLVNAPIFFEPPTAATVNNALELGIVVSDSDPNYGGCFVWVSVDGGASYGAAPIATILGNGITGALTSPWPAGLDPDTVNDLLVDLTESNGSLASYSAAEKNNFLSLIFVEGASTCTYELASYQTATLTSPHHYTIPAAVGIRRDVFHQPPAGSVAHGTGKRFAFLGPLGTGVPIDGIALLPMQPLWEGVTLKFKFQAFNQLLGGVQDLASCTAYSYTPGGCAIVPAADIVTMPVTSPAPGTFVVPHGLSYTPAFVVVQMTSNGDIWPISWDGTNVTLGATDTGLTALVTMFANPAAANVPLSPALAGNFSVPHGLPGTPTVSISQEDVPATFWRQSTAYTSTDLNLVASADGITGKDYAWIVPPTTLSLPRFARMNLTPALAGNFTVAHGLAWTPKLVIVRMSAGGLIYLQYPTFADATNLYLTASADGLTGEAMIWG